MKTVQKILLGFGAVATTMLMASPANAWYVVRYASGGFEGYCDNGYMFDSVGPIYGPIDSIEYHTGEPPC